MRIRSLDPMIDVTLFTDPACPFAFSAEPARLRLAWAYGEQLHWSLRMIVLTREPGEARKLAAGAPNLQRIHGMPIDPSPYPRQASSEPACRAVVAARLHAPESEALLLRQLRVRVMAGGLLDDPELIDGAAVDAGLDPVKLRAWTGSAEAGAVLEQDAAAARDPLPAARALNHKLGGPADQRRYTAPSYELRRGRVVAAVAGFNPVEVYETAIANLAPGLERRAAPDSVEAALAWAPHPLATAEVVALTGGEPAVVRAALSRVATPIASGADCYWTLR